MGAAEEARKLDRYGFNVLPAKPKQKSPTVSWAKWQHKRATHMIDSWFGDRPANYWIATGGISNIYVLDIDSAQADQWWRDVVGFGSAMDATVCVKSRKGHHYYFWVPSSDLAKGWAYHDSGIEFDVRGTGGGVIAPPSVHESGFQYQWVREPDPDKPMFGMVEAPEWLKSREGVQQYIGRGRTADPEQDAQALKNTNTRSMLTSLLGKPPAEGGRNDWLTKVAGHYARQFRRMQDAYQYHVNEANRKLDKPLSDAEVTKITTSVWTTETTQHPERDMADTGWVTGAGNCMVTQTKRGKGQDAELSIEEWADFDVRVQGVISGDADGSGNLIYDCAMTRKRDGGVLNVLIPGKVFGQPQKLNSFLHSYGVSISRPDGTYPTNPPDPIRLLRYLDTQDAPRWRMVPALGWDETSRGFLAFEGIIRDDGIHEFEMVRPDPTLNAQGRARYHYGFQDGTEAAREILAEVATYHEETTAAVFGSWWAACLLKPQLQSQVSLFPVMAIESPSGSGKTNGYFALMMQLNGSLQGPGISTVASTRDRIAAHHSGIVWIDDMDSLGKIEELLRATTSNETITKKSWDNMGNVNAQLVAPVVVSGEQLGLGSQKALMDRIVLINPPKPDGRLSLKKGREGEPQWDDIVQLTNRHPLTQSGGYGLTVYAGTLVQMALQLETGTTARLRAARKQLKAAGVEGRQVDKIAVVIAGAWLLDRMLDPGLPTDQAGPNEQRVISWSTTDQARSFSAGEWDNRVTQELVPWALREYGWPSSPSGHPPVWIEDDPETLEDPTVWVNCSGLADKWRDSQRGRVVERTDTRKAVMDQIKRCQTYPRSKIYDTARGRQNRAQARYYALEGEVARVVVERSQE